PGDVNAFFGLMLDNVANLLLSVGLLSTTYNFPANFALRYMLPGTAIGVLVGDLIFTWMAIRLARLTGHKSMTAMPLGIDTPSTLGIVFFVLGPAFVAARQAGLDELAAARNAWHIGVCVLVASGLFKLAAAPVADSIRRAVPRAGLLGSLAAIALVLISFLPFLEVMQHPVAGFVSLGIILMTLVARLELPAHLPGALVALLVGGGVFYALRATGFTSADPLIVDPGAALFPTEWLTAFRCDWLSAWRQSLAYLPVALPFALATIVGGIDCTESAAAAGDEFGTGGVVAVEAVATLAAAFCGGVIQTTPYIGHPAYKAMGARSGYTLATALFVGSAGLLGYFGYLYMVIPKAVIFPILIFVGLEISSQSFHATPVRHYPALALACLPALASLVMIFAEQVLGATQQSIATLADQPASAALAETLQTLRVLASGFVVTGLLWASTLAMLIDRRFWSAAAFLITAAACSLFGIIHSPLAGSPLMLPWSLPINSLPFAAAARTPLVMAAAYSSMALTVVACGYWLRTDKNHYPERK
ncbi:MAG TPA: permease, partial [Pirellulales bacterium]|nr:permease [Pirellulales bacterium]